MSDEKLKFASDRIMDFFDDVVLNVPGKTKEERIVTLVDVLIPRLIDRASEAGAIDANTDLTSKDKAAYMQLLRKCIDEDREQDCVAAVLVRVKGSGEVKVAGASKGLADAFIERLSGIVRNAVYQFSAKTAAACGCPVCVQMRKDNPVFSGPIGQA